MSKVGVAAVALLLLAGAGALAYFNTRVDEAARGPDYTPAAATWSAFERCFLGERAGGMPSRRAHDIALLALPAASGEGDPQARLAVGPGDWPRRCVRHGRQFERAVREAVVEHQGGPPESWPPLLDRLEQVLVRLDKAQLPRAADTDGLFREVAASIPADPGAAGAGEVPPAPPPAKPLRALTPLGGPGAALVTSKVRSGALHLKLGDSVRVCRLLTSRAPAGTAPSASASSSSQSPPPPGSSAAPPATATASAAARAAAVPAGPRLASTAYCRFAADAVPRSDHWYGVAATDAEQDSYLLVDQPSAAGGLYSVGSGEQIVSANLAWGQATVRADGFVAAFGPQSRGPGGLVLRRRRPGGSAEVIALDRPTRREAGATELVWDQLLWVETPADGSLHLLARAVTAVDEPPLGPPVEVAILPRLDARMQVCRTAEALFVHFGGSRQLLAIHRSGAAAAEAWTVVRPGTAEHGQLSCQGSTATLTAVLGSEPSGVPRIARVSCSIAGCETKTGAFTASPQQALGSARAAAIDLAGQTLVVWLDQGVRMLAAPIEHLAGSQPVVLFDNTKDFGTAVTSLQLVARGATAVVLLDTADGLVAIQVSADGRYEPVRVVEQP